MKRQKKIFTWTAVIIGIVALGIIGYHYYYTNYVFQQRAETILDETGIQGGFIVHLGCEKGKLTAALRTNDRFIVHGLTRSQNNVKEARRYIRNQGLYGKITVEQLEGQQLPYIDNLVNLVVAEHAGDVDMEEIMRVLAPEGIVYIREDGEWHTKTKSRPETIDEWTHFLHGPDNNAVANDQEAGPPRQMQWLSEPMWDRNHHTMASISSVVSSGGRIFYIADESPAASIEIPSNWKLIARDAFNGTLLWKKSLSTWTDHLRGFRSGPVQLPRLLVAKNNRVYVPLDSTNTLNVLDAATGKVVQTYPQASKVEEIVVDNGLIFAVTGKPLPEQAIDRENWRNEPEQGKRSYPNQKKIKAFRAETGEKLWEWSDSRQSRYLPLTLAVADERVFFQSGENLFCYDQHTGNQEWSHLRGAEDQDESEGIPGPSSGLYENLSEKEGEDQGKSVRIPGWSFATLAFADQVVLSAYRGELIALDSKTGRKLWSADCEHGFHSPVDIMAINGKVWTGGYWPGKVSGRYGDMPFSEVRDLHTGEVIEKNQVVRNLWTAGHHPRCYRNKATTEYIMTGKRGIEFIDVDSTRHSRNNWVRGVCQYGIMPGNGMIYAPPHACGCYPESLLYGFWAIGPGNNEKTNAQRTTNARVERGPAFRKVKSDQKDDTLSESWPTYRNDPQRSGSSDMAITSDITTKWKTKAGEDLTPPVIADGKVFVSSKSTNQIKALNAQDGSEIWSFTTGGPVDSPPTIYKNRVIFGSGDGSIYCLRISDGKLAWRFHTKFTDQRTIVRDQLESVWPVHGSVLIQDDIVYFSAGRSSYLDGGMLLYGLDPETGEILHTSRLQSEPPDYSKSLQARQTGNYSKESIDTTITPDNQNAVDWKTLTDPDKSDAFSMSGAISDVLVGDGSSIYMKHLRYDKNLEKQPDKGTHLFSTSRLLDDSEVHRTHWVLGIGEFSRLEVAYPWIANSRGGRGGTHLAAPYGLMLSFTTDSVWGIWRRYRENGYLLWANKKQPRSKTTEHTHDFRETAGNPTDHLWSEVVDLHPRSLIKSRNYLFIGGTPGFAQTKDPYMAFTGREGGILRIIDASNGQQRAGYKLDSPPVWDGMAAADNRLFISMEDGTIQCFGK